MTSLLTGSAVLVTGENRRGNDNYGFGYSCHETTGARMKRTFQSATTAFIEVSKDGHRFADFLIVKLMFRTREETTLRSAQSLTGSDLSVQIPRKVSEVTLQSSHKSWKISTKLGFLTDTAAQGSAQPTEQTVVGTVL
ncbi:hypothetical protein FCULG_00000390 [Fusarium culmorum]|uniref:Uncharacterized protein n=1 Tax=Fusarium culmorum TaxID=5516 RepID=A0A2T4GPB0_FUSCU|nr:hypothetical protein FCULG_00000390 [Fusarium culmorum]